MNPDELNRLLWSLTFVSAFSFTTDAKSGDCTVQLEMADDLRRSARRVALKFAGVSGLELREWGGGFTQLMCLHVDDLRSKQWDRISYRVVDLEHGRLEFLCKSIEATIPDARTI